MSIGTTPRKISNSSLDWIKLGPRVFKLMWNRELAKTSSKSLDLGSALHCYLLENDRFQEEYVIVDVKTVGGLMGPFIKAVHLAKLELLPTEDDLPEEVYQSIADKLGFKIGLKAIMKGYNDPKYDAYKETLKASHGSFTVSRQDMDVITACATAIESHKLAGPLILGTGIGTSDNVQIESEMVLEADMTGEFCVLPSIGLLDRVIIDHGMKKITLVDLKTTSSSVYLFQESYNRYDYDRQMAFYNDLLLKIYPEYSIDTYIVAVQTTYTTHTTDCAVFKIESDEIEKGRKKYQRMLDRVSWHMSNDVWDYPQEYYESIGLCQINRNP